MLRNHYGQQKPPIFICQLYFFQPTPIYIGILFQFILFVHKENVTLQR